MAYMAILKTIGGTSAPLGSEGEYQYMVFCSAEHAQSYAENHSLTFVEEDETAEFNQEDRCQFCGESAV